MNAIINAMIALNNDTDYSKMPLTFKAQKANSAVKLNVKGSYNACRLQYRINYSKDWLTLNFNSISSEYYTDQSQTIILQKIGDIVQFQNLDMFLSDQDYDYRIYNFECTGDLEIYGNLLSLINYNNSIPKFAFYDLFRNCIAITNAQNLILNSNSLSQSCYSGLFNDCTSLIIAPKLPAITLAEACYQGLFYGCKSLLKAPKLPATTLANSCYSEMFSGCKSLTSMPELPAIDLSDYCYFGMFNSCTNLTTASELMATTLNVDNAYSYMFNGCSLLNSIKVHFTNWYSNATNQWLGNVSSNGTFTCPVSLNIERGVSRIPNNWTIITY